MAQQDAHIQTYRKRQEELDRTLAKNRKAVKLAEKKYAEKLKKEEEWRKKYRAGLLKKKKEAQRNERTQARKLEQQKEAQARRRSRVRKQKWKRVGRKTMSSLASAFAMHGARPRRRPSFKQQRLQRMAVPVQRPRQTQDWTDAPSRDEQMAEELMAQRQGYPEEQINTPEGRPSFLSRFRGFSNRFSLSSIPQGQRSSFGGQQRFASAGSVNDGRSLNPLHAPNRINVRGQNSRLMRSEPQIQENIWRKDKERALNFWKS